MTNDQIRRKIAMACGWIYNPDSEYHKQWMDCDQTFWSEECLPNYPESHDAMAEAIGTLNGSEIVQFAQHILGMSEALTDAGWHDIIGLVIASPAQKAEAFLKVNGLWEEGE